MDSDLTLSLKRATSSDIQVLGAKSGGIGHTLELRREDLSGRGDGATELPPLFTFSDVKDRANRTLRI